jgi:hypothetical protein
MTATAQCQPFSAKVQLVSAAKFLRNSCRADHGWFDVSIEHRSFVHSRPHPGFGSEPIKETAMRFLSISKTVERNSPPTQEEMAAMGKLMQEAMEAGWLVSAEGCMPSAVGARVRRSDGKVTVVDGPFTESTEVIGGFAILNANSREEAIELVKPFLSVLGQGECEVRQLYE